MPGMAPTEIMALARIMGELDYYQLLHLERSASPSDVKRAYHACSRTFHPDANRHLAGDLRDSVCRVAKVITEAYQVLRDPRRRSAYDRTLTADGRVRIRLAEATPVAAPPVVAPTPCGCASALALLTERLAALEKAFEAPAAAYEEAPLALTIEKEEAPEQCLPLAVIATAAAVGTERLSPAHR